ncbi:hypothetical protein LB545_05845 [Mesorhizobium sp. BR1-1-6]|uniref:hypothetical protein n=1 Tax=unclassified Mesorhizobium TaxID=325217 RepID=UPI00112B8017|nr:MULTISPECIES: hypothetical protein [unclassified Mesorhizobium]MBZ9893860.1 hypothetical protein [Mesorhizobium sp. BR1-1-6]TPN12176.1 hypothetical protein FJ973_15995 [Mesorhizobium sp. B2-1-3]
MRSFFLASMMALAASASVIAPTQAASVTIQSGDEPQYSPDDDYDNGEVVVRRHYDRQRYIDNRYNDDEDSDVRYSDREYRRYHRHHRCHIELVKHWRHHHRVIEEVRVCT